MTCCVLSVRMDETSILRLSWSVPLYRDPSWWQTIKNDGCFNIALSIFVWEESYSVFYTKYIELDHIQIIRYLNNQRGNGSYPIFTPKESSIHNSYPKVHVFFVFSHIFGMSYNCLIIVKQLINRKSMASWGCVFPMDFHFISVNIGQ